MNEHKRGNWGSNLGFLLATIGSAVGLGNIWGFPYKMGENGGFAFLLVYVILAVFIGFILMITELAIGRKTGKNVVDAFKSLSRRFKWLGWMEMLAPFLVLLFYVVLAGYCLQYMFLNLSQMAFGALGGSTATGEDLFASMLTNQAGSVIFALLVIAFGYLVVKGGIKGGIEKFNKIGMPALFIMLVIVAIRSVTLPGASEGLKFMFVPNFEPLKENFFGVLATAGGQMFFSLSLAMGAILTYGSYLGKKENIVKNAGIIVISDTLVALMAGIAVLPAAFALGGEGAALSGPSLLFVTMQNVFNNMGYIGSIFGTLFYMLVLIAAITSQVSLTEVLTTYYHDRAVEKGKKPNRKKHALWVSVAIAAGAILVAIDGLGSNGLWVPFQNTFGTIGSFNDCWLDFIDTIAEGIVMPLCSFLIAICVGWELKPKTIIDEIELEGNTMRCKKFYKFCIKFIAPIGMLLILLGQIDSIFALGILG